MNFFLRRRLGGDGFQLANLRVFRLAPSLLDGEIAPRARVALFGLQLEPRRLQTRQRFARVRLLGERALDILPSLLALGFYFGNFARLVPLELAHGFQVRLEPPLGGFGFAQTLLGTSLDGGGARGGGRRERLGLLPRLGDALRRGRLGDASLGLSLGDAILRARFGDARARLELFLRLSGAVIKNSLRVLRRAHRVRNTFLRALNLQL